MSWRILDPKGNTYQGEITSLTLADCKLLRPMMRSNRTSEGWFDWESFMNSNTNYEYYKLERVGVAGILGVIALQYNDGVYVASVETELLSRHMPSINKRYVNLADIMLSFASLCGILNHNDGFVGLTPKDNKINYYTNKFNAMRYGRVYALNEAVLARMIQLYYY